MYCDVNCAESVCRKCKCGRSSLAGGAGQPGVHFGWSGFSSGFRSSVLGTCVLVLGLGVPMVGGVPSLAEDLKHHQWCSVPD